MPFTEDLTSFFNASEFATTATLNGVTVTGIFDNGYMQALVGQTGVATTTPSYQLATASVPANPVGKAMVINSLNYTVAEHQPDGTGVSMLYLERA